MSNKVRPKIGFLFSVLIGWVLFFFACKDNGVNITPCPPLKSENFPPYTEPVWHPNGQIIGFNHIPIMGIQYPNGRQCDYLFDSRYDSIGFWIINIDGSNMRRIFPSILDFPEWSPDGQWIAFGFNAQIYKMRFTGNAFDTSSITPLASAGRNFYPSWSPDGQWIAYDRSLADLSGPAGVWLMRSDGSEKRKIAGGASPSWNPDGQSLIFEIGSGSSTDIESKFVRYPVFASLPPDTFRGQSNSVNGYPKCLYDGSNIIFSSSTQSNVSRLWIMTSSGGNPVPINDDPIGPYRMAVSPSALTICYVYQDKNDLPAKYGTLWILEIPTKQKRQLTFNPMF